jgi:hypothetical protein
LNQEERFDMWVELMARLIEKYATSSLEDGGGGGNEEVA